MPFASGSKWPCIIIMCRKPHFSSLAASVAVLEAAPAICCLDLLSVLYPSQAMLAMLGKTRVSLLTCPYSDYIVVDHHLIASLMYVLSLGEQYSCIVSVRIAETCYWVSA